MYSYDPYQLYEQQPIQSYRTFSRPVPYEDPYAYGQVPSYQWPQQHFTPQYHGVGMNQPQWQPEMSQWNSMPQGMFPQQMQGPQAGFTPGNTGKRPPSNNLMMAFQDDKGQFDFNKAMSTFNQVTTTVKQVSPLVKQFGPLFQMFAGPK